MLKAIKFKTHKEFILFLDELWKLNYDKPSECIKQFVYSEENDGYYLISMAKNMAFEIEFLKEQLLGTPSIKNNDDENSHSATIVEIIDKCLVGGLTKESEKVLLQEFKKLRKSQNDQSDIAKKLAEEVTKLNAINASYQKNVMDMKQERNQLFEKLQESTQKLVQAQKKIASLSQSGGNEQEDQQEKFKPFANEIMSLRRIIADNDIEMDRLKDKIVTGTMETTKFKQMAQSTETKLALAKQRILEDEATLLTQVKNYSMLQLQNEKINNSNKLLTKENTKLNREVEKLKENLKQVSLVTPPQPSPPDTKKKLEMQKEQDQTRELIQKVKKDSEKIVKEWSTKYKVLETDFHRVKDECKTLENENKILQSQVSRLSNQTKEIQTLLNKTKSDKETLDNKLTIANKKLLETEEQVRMTKTELQTSNTKNETLEKQHQKLSREFENLVSREKTELPLKNEIPEIDTRKQELELRFAHDQIKRLNSQNIITQSALDESQNENKKLRISINILESISKYPLLKHSSETKEKVKIQEEEKSNGTEMSDMDKIVAVCNAVNQSVVTHYAAETNFAIQNCQAVFSELMQTKKEMVDLSNGLYKHHYYLYEKMEKLESLVAQATLVLPCSKMQHQQEIKNQ